MSKKKDKPSLDEILGTKLVKAKVLQGGKIKHQKSLKPKVTVEIVEGDLLGEQVNYGFLTDKAVQMLEENAEYDEEKNVIVSLPLPTNTEEDGINWVVE